MILVLCGTQKQDFSRMVKCVVETATTEEIVVQGGHNTYEIDRVRNVNFVSPLQLEELYNEATLVVTHAGAGSMIAALEHQKKVIAFPRLKKYSEHVNNHQVELARKFESLGYLLMYHEEVESFQDVYERMKSFEPLSYVRQQEMVTMIDNRITALLTNKKSSR